MLKKIFIVLVLCISFFFVNSTFSEYVGNIEGGGDSITPDLGTDVSNDDSQGITSEQKAITPDFSTDTTNTNDQGASDEEKAITPDSLKDSSFTEDNSSTLSTEGQQAKEDQEKAEKEAYDNSEDSAGDITSRGFKISVDEISPGMLVKGSTTKENVNYLLGTIIQNLMIALGSLALLIMTVGAGYILIYHGEDELLSKGKTIFMSGVYALVVALSAYYLVSIVRYLLYFGDN